MLKRLFPAQFDNRFDGQRAALWLLVLLTALTLIVSVNSIFNTTSVAVGADGLPLDSFSPAAARTILMLFSLDAVGQLALSLIALAALVRYRAMVPFIYLLVLGEQLARRFILQSYAVPRAPTEPAVPYIVFGVLVLVALGLVLSLLPARQRHSAEI
ncbi:MAG: hypothetical protein QOF05_680 [Sphingomonadales bacterium]|jgi:hypothetical protein|nr:hypothetical protein [Sphingomonadales bacterium]